MQHLEVSCAVRPIYGSLGAKGLNKTASKYVLRLTHLFILLLFCCWLQVSASKSHHQANIYKKNLKMPVHALQTVSSMGSHLLSLVVFIFIASFYVCCL
jgi:hypothetical protein